MGGRLSALAEEVASQAQPQPQKGTKKKKKEDPKKLKTKEWIARIADLIDELKAETVDKTKRDKLDLIAIYVELIVIENDLV